MSVSSGAPTTASPTWFRVQGSGFRVQGSGFRAQGSGSRVQGSGFRVAFKGNSNAHGARPVHQIISMINWIRTSRLSIKNSLYCNQHGLTPCIYSL